MMNHSLSHTVYALETTTWWGIDIVAVRAEKLHRVQSWQIRASAGHDVTTVAVDARTRAKYPGFVLVNLIQRIFGTLRVVLTTT